MATEETVQLGEPHAPHQGSIDALDSILDLLKEELVKLRRDHDSKPVTHPLLTLARILLFLEHEPEYFQAVKSLSDGDLTSFSASDIDSVRVANSAYGLHIFAKIRIPAVDNAYIHVRVFGSAKEGTDGSSLDEREYKLHSIHTEEIIKEDDRVYRAIFNKDDALEWFDT